MSKLVRLDKSHEPEMPEIVYLECVAMPNGEIISEGKTVGFIKRLGGSLFKSLSDTEYNEIFKEEN